MSQLFKTRRKRNTRKILSSEQFSIEGLDVRINRKQVKNITLHIKPPNGLVEISAPVHEPLETIASFVRQKKSWILKQQRALADSPQSQAARADKAEQAAWREVVEACVPALVAAWEPIMGVKAGKLVYRNMTSRWGSCQPSTGRICINTRLALYPPQCLEYVVVHELCHLIEKSHGPRFKKAMDTFMPDWKERRALLNES